MRQPVEDTIREKVRALLLARGETSYAEFGAAIGRGYAWVHAFQDGKGTGRRHANDIHLVVKIARYFGVSVGYLLNESERGRDAGAATLLATWDRLTADDREVVLQLALSLVRRGGSEGGGESDAATDAPPSGAPRMPGSPGKVRGRKLR